MLQGVFLSFLFLFDVQVKILLCHALKWIHSCEHVKVLINMSNIQVGNMGVMLRLIYDLTHQLQDI